MNLKRIYGHTVVPKRHTRYAMAEENIASVGLAGMEMGGYDELL